MTQEALKLALTALEINLTLLEKITPYKGQEDFLSDAIAITQNTTTFIKKALAQPEQEPVAWADHGVVNWIADKQFKHTSLLYNHPPQRNPLTEREVELLDGMIQVQLDHASRCDAIANRTMTEKQKGWDMERVALLQKLKAAHGIKE
jgi:hypothetical protein